MIRSLLRSLLTPSSTKRLLLLLCLSYPLSAFHSYWSPSYLASLHSLLFPSISSLPFFPPFLAESCFIKSLNLPKFRFSQMKISHVRVQSTKIFFLLTLLCLFPISIFAIDLCIILMKNVVVPLLSSFTCPHFLVFLNECHCGVGHHSSCRYPVGDCSLHYTCDVNQTGKSHYYFSFLICLNWFLLSSTSFCVAL